MSVYRRGQRALKSATPEQAQAIEGGVAGKPWTVEVQLGNVRYTLSSGTDDQEVAKGMERMLKDLYSMGSDEYLGLLRKGRLSLRDVYPVFKSGKGLGQLLTRVQEEDEMAAQPKLGVLIPEWYAWLQSSPVSERSKREIAASTAARYEVSMERLLAFIGRKHFKKPGPASAVSEKEAIEHAWKQLTPAVFTSETLRSFRKARKDGGKSAGTINRDLNTFLAFYSWLETEKKLTFVRPKVIREQEPGGRERALEREEWLAVGTAFHQLSGGVTQVRGRRSGGTASEGVVPMKALWILFETLVLTGLRLGEALALEWGDLNVAQGTIRISRSLEWRGLAGTTDPAPEGAPVREGRLKTLGSARFVPLGSDLATRLAVHRSSFKQFGSGRKARVFPALVFNARRMQSLWNRAVEAAGIEHVRVHDLRHTFAVHALENGITVNTLQAVLGHSNAHMVMRYVRRQNLRQTNLTGDKVAGAILALPEP